MTSTVRVSSSDVEAAHALLADVARVTPLEASRPLADRAGGPVWLKCENLQRAGSFKVRGAYVRINRLSENERARGVVAASAGNHAQGVALAAQLVGTQAVVYMPSGAPIPKENATRSYGADVRFAGHTVDEALRAAQEHCARTGAVLIHPFDHPDVVAGQGTIGLEILRQCPDVGTILVGTGGGGLLAGIGAAVGEPHNRATAVPQSQVATSTNDPAIPETAAAAPGGDTAETADTVDTATPRTARVRLVGAQAAGAAAYPESLRAGHPVALSTMSTMADGIAVGRPGDVPFDLVSAYADEIVTVSEEALAEALLLLLERAKMVVEPAGAAAVAALLEYPERFEPPVVAVLSGGNIDPLLLMRVVRYGMIAAGRFLSLTVRIPDHPGALARLLGELAAVEANVLDVSHQRTAATLHVDEVEVALHVETRGAPHRRVILDRLRSAGYPLHFS